MARCVSVSYYAWEYSDHVDSGDAVPYGELSSYSVVYCFVVHYGDVVCSVEKSWSME